MMLRCFEVLAANVAFFAAHGVVGVFEEGAYQGPGGELNELKDWVMTSALWSPAKAARDDGRALITEFLQVREAKLRALMLSSLLLLFGYSSELTR